MRSGRYNPRDITRVGRSGLTDAKRLHQSFIARICAVFCENVTHSLNALCAAFNHFVQESLRSRISRCIAIYGSSLSGAPNAGTHEFANKVIDVQLLLEYFPITSNDRLVNRTHFLSLDLSGFSNIHLRGIK